MQQTIRRLAKPSAAVGLLVVAQWEAKEGQARQQLPKSSTASCRKRKRIPAPRLFLIGRNKDNPAQFLFYELFRDEAALKAHQESGYFKTYIAGQALPLLAKRERAQYAPAVSLPEAMRSALTCSARFGSIVSPLAEDQLAKPAQG